jgi:predicted aldo/keto reductase-like oxidoreductase
MNLLTEEYIKENVPKLGFGLMRLPVKGSNTDIDIEHFKKMVDHYMDSGMNYFDTAYFYHDGASEGAFKEAVVKRYPRDSYTVADKMPIWLADSHDDVERIFNEQLARCGVEYFDYYLIHALDGDKHAKNEKLGAYDFCLKMKKQGKIKSLGFSFHGSTEDLKQILSERPELEFVQLQINYYDWEFEAKEHYEIVRAHKKPIIIMEPVRGGFLAKMPAEIEKIFKDVQPNLSVASWSIRWVASLEGVMTVLSGMSTIEQLEDNVSYMKDFKPLTSEEDAAVSKAVNVLLEAPTIPCTDCKYCIECPIEIPIFDIFGVYNEFINTKSVSSFKKAYAEFEIGSNAAACVECGLCEAVCPQTIEIINWLADIDALA